jgi:hypothetical protein
MMRHLTIQRALAPRNGRAETLMVLPYRHEDVKVVQPNSKFAIQLAAR